MTRSQFLHAVQYVAELTVGRRVREAGMSERAAFGQAMSQRTH